MVHTKDVHTYIQYITTLYVVQRHACPRHIRKSLGGEIKYRLQPPERAGCNGASAPPALWAEVPFNGFRKGEGDRVWARGWELGKAKERRGKGSAESKDSQLANVRFRINDSTTESHVVTLSQHVVTLKQSASSQSAFKVRGAAPRRLQCSVSSAQEHDVFVRYLEYYPE